MTTWGTTWKVSKHGDFMNRIFLYSDWMREYSVPIQENTDQKKLLIWTLFTQRGFNFLHSEIENCISCKRLIVQTIVRSLENVMLKKSRAGYLLTVIFSLVQKSLRVASLAFHFLSFTALFLDRLVFFLFMNRYPRRSV